MNQQLQSLLSSKTPPTLGALQAALADLISAHGCDCPCAFTIYTPDDVCLWHRQEEEAFAEDTGEASSDNRLSDQEVSFLLACIHTESAAFVKDHIAMIEGLNQIHALAD